MLVKRPGHGHGDSPLSRKHFRYLGPVSNERHEVAGGQVGLVHSERDGGNWVGKADGMVPLFVEFNQVGKHIQLDPVGIIYILDLPFRSRQRVHECGYPGQRSVIVLF